MGCEQSQTSSIVPRQPHAIEKNQLKNHKLQEKHYTNENGTQSVVYHTKENQKPKEVLKGKQKENYGGALEKKTASEAQFDEKQKRKLTDVPMADCTNLEKAFIRLESDKSKAKNAQKAKCEQKIQKESMVGLSSKSIEIGEVQKKQLKEEGHKVKDFVNIQELAGSNVHKVEVEQKADLASKIKIKSVKQIKEGTQKSIKVEQKNNFTLQHWDKDGGEQQLSRIQRLGRVDQMQIQREQVRRYLNSVWSYEKEVLNNIIAKLQVQQYKKIEQPITTLE